jgi:hypothetical protein
MTAYLHPFGEQSLMMTITEWPTEAACFNWLVQVEVKSLEILLLGTYCPDVCIVERANETLIAHADLEAFGSSSEIWEAVPDLLAEVCSVIRTEQAGFRWINLGTELHQRKSDGSVLVHHRVVLETPLFAVVGAVGTASRSGSVRTRLPRHERTRCLMKTNPAVKQAVDFLAQPSTFGSLYNAYEVIMKSNGMKAKHYLKIESSQGSTSCLRADAGDAESFYRTANAKRHSPRPRHPNAKWKDMSLREAESFVRMLFYQWIDSLENTEAGEP